MNRGFGERVKRLREQANLSRKFVAAQVGISVTRLTQIESGQCDEGELTASVLKALVKMFHVTVDYLIGGPLGIAEDPQGYRVIARRAGTALVQSELSFAQARPVQGVSYGMDACLTCHRPVSGVKCDHCGRAIE